MEPDYTAWKFWLDVAQWLVTLSLALFVWFDRGRRDNQGAIKELTQKMERIEHRVLKTEEQMLHIPTHDDIAQLRAQTAALESKLDGVGHTVDVIHDYLMNQK